MKGMEYLFRFIIWKRYSPIILKKQGGVQGSGIMRLSTFWWAGSRHLRLDIWIWPITFKLSSCNPVSASYATWAEASRAFQNRNMHWRLSIQTHGPVEDISDLIHIMVRSGSISISALMRSLGARLCMKPLSSRWLSASNFFKEAADSLCLYHWKLLYRDFEKIHWPPPTNQLVNLTVFRSLAFAEIEISCVSGHTLDPL